MSALGNNEIFAKNLRYYIEKSGKDRRELAEIWGFPYSTVTEWINGKKYPRIGRIEIMADYFGIQKSDLIEDKENPTPVSESGQHVNIVKIAGRDGSFIEKHLNDKELQALKAFVDLLPDADDL